jgi:hypothetical protein
MYHWVRTGRDLAVAVGELELLGARPTARDPVVERDLLADHVAATLPDPASGIAMRTGDDEQGDRFGRHAPMLRLLARGANPG